VTQTAGRGQCGRPSNPIISALEENPMATSLTDDQLAALRLAANGFSSRQIGVRLGATESAIHQRLNTATVSLGGRSRTHAVAIAIARGLICLDEIQARDAV
jgi:DNA-binding NarL/FixJ family response regulator